MVLDLNFGDGCGCASSRIELPVDFQASRSEFSHDKNLVFQKLRDMAIQDSSSGIYAGIERKNILEPKSEVTSYAIVTNIVRYNCLLGLAAFEVIHRSLGKFTKKRSESRNGNRGSPKRLKVS